MSNALYEFQSTELKESLADLELYPQMHASDT